MSSYSIGTVSVSQGSTTVTGAGTAWQTFGLRAGDRFNAAGLTVEIAAVGSNTQLTLANAWPGATLSAANYRVFPTDDGVRALTAANALLVALGQNGNLTSIGALASQADRVPYYTGPGAAALAVLTGFGRSLIAAADAPAARSALSLGTAATGTLTTSALDATTGRVLRVGDSATALRLSTALRVPAGGTANALALTPGVGMTGTPPTGLRVRFRAALANTGAATIAFDGGTPIACRTVTGAVLPAGYIRTDVDTIAEYDGTHWILDRQAQVLTGPNGVAIREANGRQRCSHRVLIKPAADATAGNKNVEWTFPAGFVFFLGLTIRVDHQVEATSPETRGRATSRLLSNTTADLWYFEQTGVAGDIFTSATADGFWY